MGSCVHVSHSHGFLHGLQLVVMFPIALPSISRVAFTNQIHTSSQWTLENLTQAILILEEALDSIVFVVTHPQASFLVISAMAMEWRRPRAGQALLRAAADE